MDEEKLRGGLLALLVASSAVIGVVTVVGTATAGHGADNGNYTVSLPFASDHYPGDKNQENGSINHYAAGTKEIFENAGAPDGFSGLKFIIIQSEDVDFSQCTTSNTAAFGIDRDNDDPGTKTDVSLLNYREDSKFQKNGIIIDFFEGDELSAPSDAPINMNVNDEIVAHQGYKSSGGPCYTMPSEPGWYQIMGFINGTAKGSGEYAEFDIPSHYFYICECNSEKEAYEKLGAPPGQDNPYAEGDQSSQSSASSASTPEPTPTPTPEPKSTPTATATPEPSTPTPDQSTPTPKRSTPTPTDAPAQSGGGGGGGGGANAGGSNGGNGNSNVQASGPSGGQQQAPATATPAQRSSIVTPTVAEGPGFGAALALVALAGAALLGLRRND